MEDRNKTLEDQLQNEFFMRRCLELASTGAGRVAPNPMVGAVIVCDDRIIGEGFHRYYGQAHAEVNAIAAVSDTTLLKKSTLYVNLEPCAHMGKTPPCSDLIIEKEIPRVVIGTSDPNLLVAGKGIEKLRNHKVDVTTGILRKECEWLNRRFFTFHTEKRPYIILKWARSADGFIDKLRVPGANEGINWISNPLSRTLVHRWRAEEQGILVGTKAVLIDNPQLNLRHWPGNNPLRIVLDRNLKIDPSANVLDNSQQTLVINEQIEKVQGKTRFVKLDFQHDFLKDLLNELYRMEILSVIVEGGARTLQSFISEDLWDEARVITGKIEFGKGLPAPHISGTKTEYELLGDRVTFYTRESNRYMGL